MKLFKLIIFLLKIVYENMNIIIVFKDNQICPNKSKIGLVKFVRNAYLFTKNLITLAQLTFSLAKAVGFISMVPTVLINERVK